VPSAEPTRTSCQWSVDEGGGLVFGCEGKRGGWEGDGRGGRGKGGKIGRREGEEEKSRGKEGWKR
jgi:hypothetical protein